MAALGVAAAPVVIPTLVETAPPSVATKALGQRPNLFYRSIDGDVPQFGRSIGAAHNAGDERHDLQRALAHGAHVIEVDVRMLNGRLIASHDQPYSWLGRSLYRGPSLSETWATIDHAGRAVMLDLKQSDTAFVAAVARFLESRDDGRVAVVSPSMDVLDRLQRTSPRVARFASVPTLAALDEWRSDARFGSLVDGISISDRVATAEVMAWARELGLVVAVWVVDDFARVGELAAMGADIITSDNLAVLEALGTSADASSTLFTAARAGR